MAHFNLYIFFVMLTDRFADFLIIIEEVNTQRATNKDHRNQCCCLDAFRSCRAGAVHTLTQQQRADHNHKALAQLIGKVTGSQEHTGTVLAGLNGIILGKIGEHGGGDDIGDGNRHGNHQTDHDGECRSADQTDHEAVTENSGIQQHIGDACTQQHGLLAHLPGQDIHQGVCTHAHTDGDYRNDGHPYIRQRQQIGNIVNLGSIKEGECHPHDQITDGDDGEVFIGEDSLQRLANGLAVGLGLDEVLLLDYKGRDQRSHSTCGAADNEGNPQRPDLGNAGIHQNTLEHGGAEYQSIGNHIEEAVEGVQQHTLPGLRHDFRLQSRVGNVIEGGEQIVQDQQYAYPHSVHIAGAVHRREENQQAAHTVRDGTPAHEGNASTQLVGAFIRQIGNPGVGDGIHHGADATDDRHDQRCVQEESGQRGIAVCGDEECQKIGGHNAADNAPGKVAHAQRHNLSVGQFFHESLSFFLLFLLLYNISQGKQPLFTVYFRGSLQIFPDWQDPIDLY